jgi:hypothetical protein
MYFELPWFIDTVMNVPVKLKLVLNAGINIYGCHGLSLSRGTRRWI